MFVRGAQVQILRSMQKTAVGDWHLAAYCFPWARDDDETELEVRHQRIVEASCLKRCYPRNPGHRLSERGGDDTARVERCLWILIRSRSFLLMYALNLSHCHSLLRLCHSAVAANPEMLP